MLNLSYFICDNKGFLQAMNMIKMILSIVRFAVPLLLIITITVDLFKNVINPEDKDGTKNIKNRVLAAVFVFLIPTLIDLIMNIIGKSIDGPNTNYKLSNCYLNATDSCIKNIDDYLNCKDHVEDKDCQKFRQCNNYTLILIQIVLYLLLLSKNLY